MDQAVRFESLIINKYATKWMSFTAFKYADNNEKKKTFRKIERLQNEIIKLKCHLQRNIYKYIQRKRETYMNVHE